MNLSPIEYIGSKPRKRKNHNPFRSFLVVFLIVGIAGYAAYEFGVTKSFASQLSANKKLSAKNFVNNNLNEESRLNTFLASAIDRTTFQVSYDPAYYEIPYPMGDIPDNKGVCSDVIVRTYRKIGVDLQQLVHEDMQLNYNSYPKNWDLNKPDPNIDHRRVSNLQNFFMRNGKSLTLSQNTEDYQVGDIVTWKLSHGAPHIGIVVPSPVEEDVSPWIVHNVGLGPQWENSLFNYQITGHFRYKVD